MKKRILIALSAFLTTGLAAITVSPVITDEASFFSIPEGETIETYRSFHAEAYEDGDNEKQNVAIGDGDFTTYNSAYDVDPNWTVNTEYDFTLSYDASGNLAFTVSDVGTTDEQGNTLPLIYQPLNATNQVYIANDNIAGSLASGMEMTDMVFSSGDDVVVLPDLVTTNSSFKGLVLSDFDETWSLDGKINFTSTMDQIDHKSSFKFYGAAAAMTEPNPDIKVMEMSVEALDEVYYEDVSQFSRIKASYAWRISVQGGWTDSPHHEVIFYRPDKYPGSEPKSHHNWGSTNGELYPFNLVYDENGLLTFSMAGAQPYSLSANIEYDFDEIWIELQNAYEHWDFVPDTFVKIIDAQIDNTSIGVINASNATDIGEGGYGRRVFRIWGFENTFEMSGLISMSAEGVTPHPNKTDQIIRIFAPQSSVAQTAPISVSISQDETGVTINYSGILQESETLEGSWEDVIPQPASKSNVPTDRESKFFRAREK